MSSPGGKPAFGGTTPTITTPLGELLFSEKFEESYYDFSGLHDGKAKIRFTASTNKAKVQLPFTGTDQEADENESLIRFLRTPSCNMEPDNSLSIKILRARKTHHLEDLVCNLCKRRVGIHPSWTSKFRAGVSG